MAEISQADMERLMARGMELFGEDDKSDLAIELLWREHRVTFFTRMWESLSLYAEEAVWATTIKGEYPSAEQAAQLYRLQMHSVVLLALTGSMRVHCSEHFQPGFLDAAAAAGMMDRNDMPLFKDVDPEIDLDLTTAAERRMGLATTRALRMLDAVLGGGQATCLKAARHKGTLVIQPGYTDPRIKGVTLAASADVDPIRVPHKPHDDVDFVVDVLQGLRAAGADSKMKAEAHAFTAERVALKEIRLWRGNYFALKLD